MGNSGKIDYKSLVSFIVSLSCIVVNILSYTPGFIYHNTFGSCAIVVILVSMINVLINKKKYSINRIVKVSIIMSYLTILLYFAWPIIEMILWDHRQRISFIDLFDHWYWNLQDNKK